MTTNDTSQPLHFVAVDPSLTSTGFAVFDADGKLIKCGSVKTVAKDDLDFRHKIIMQVFMGLFYEYPNCVLLIEAQFIQSWGGFSSNGVLKVTEVVGLIEGIYYAHCFANQFSFRRKSILPRLINKLIGLKTTLKRKELKEYTRQRIDYLYPKAKIPNQDAYDAIAIGIGGMMLWKRDRLLEKVKKVDKVEKVC